MLTEEENLRDDLALLCMIQSSISHPSLIQWPELKPNSNLIEIDLESMKYGWVDDDLMAKKLTYAWTCLGCEFKKN